LKGREDIEGDVDTPAAAARGPVGIPLGPVGGMIGEPVVPGTWRGGSEPQPPRPTPRGVKPMPRVGT